VTHQRLASLIVGLFLAAGVSSTHAEPGIASVYSGEDTASGERENSGALIAALGFADQLKRDKNSELDVMAIMKSEEGSP
jgi:hypothetical protein